MAKAAFVYTLLIIALAGVTFGAVCHTRFTKAGGQREIYLVTRKAQSAAMRRPYRGMQIGYGTFVVATAVALLIKGIWGPVR